VTAPEGQTLVQVWQPSQSPARTAEALPSTMSKTLTGQLLAHSSHPSHFAASTDTKYIEIPPLFFIQKRIYLIINKTLYKIHLLF
jgi:hypothetical protein